MKVIVAFACFQLCFAGSVLESRITNGELAEEGQFPHQVGLALYIGDKKAWCGGSLISRTWILTAAHCTEKAKGVDILMGTRNSRDPKKRVIYASKRNIIVHEKWSRFTLTNDISLIRIPFAVTFNKYIRAIALPQMSRRYSKYLGEIATASGWGKTADNDTEVTDFLRYIEAPIIKNSICRLYFFGNVRSSHICIKSGSAHKSTCSGDSGGPLTIDQNGNPVLIGLTSFGVGIGCEAGFPAVFTRITDYLDWIFHHTGIRY